MNVLAATRAYVDRIVSDPNNPGMKVLLLDAETTSTGQRLQPDGDPGPGRLLVERLDQARGHEPMRHLKAAAFVRPTLANLPGGSHDPRFGEYHPALRERRRGRSCGSSPSPMIWRSCGRSRNLPSSGNSERRAVHLEPAPGAAPEYDAPTADLLRRNVDGVLFATLKVQPATPPLLVGLDGRQGHRDEVQRRRRGRHLPL